MLRWPMLLATTMFATVWAAGEEDVGSKMVIGPQNVDLYDGAQALLAGNAVDGVELTLRGLQLAHSDRERKNAHANLCAGYLLLGQAETALTHCNWVLERDDRHWRTYNNRALVYLTLKRYDESEQDIRKGQELNPRSENLKEVKGMYLDEVEPVAEKIVIDDRRNEPNSPVKDPD